MSIDSNMTNQREEQSFHYNSLTIYLHHEVYEPAEDTFLLLESISVIPGQKILEIGSGTGIISLSYASQGAEVICSDINPHAIKIIQRNIQENHSQLKGSIEVRTGNLFDILHKDERFDIIIFNPPYLPTTNEDKKGMSEWYTRSFDGGETGLQVTTRFLKECKRFLKKDGHVYIIISSFSKQENITRLLEEITLKHQVINKLRCDDEILYVYRFTP